MPVMLVSKCWTLAGGESACESEFGTASWRPYLNGYKLLVKTVLGQKPLVGLNLGWVLTHPVWLSRVIVQVLFNLLVVGSF